MCSGGPYVTVEELTFVARFLLDPGTDTEESVASVDALVDLPDGSSWALTIVTIDEVRRLLTVWGGDRRGREWQLLLGGRSSDRARAGHRGDDRGDPGTCAQRDIASAGIRSET